MKYLVFIFALLLCSIHHLHAQYDNERDAGKYLQKSANYMYAGMALTAISVVPILLPPFGTDTTKGIPPNAGTQNSKKFNDNGMAINFGVSGVIGLTAIICYVNGINYIKLAGKELELQSYKNMVGVAIKF